MDKVKKMAITGAAVGLFLTATGGAFAHAIPSNPYDPPNSNCQGKNVAGHLAERRAANGNAGGGWRAAADEVHGLTVQENQVIAKTDCGTGNFGN